MAGLKAHAGQNGVTTGTSAKTLLQLAAPANQRLKVTEVSISFRGTSNTDPPVLVELVKQTTAGTMSAATPVKRVGTDDETLQATAQHTATSEPTTTDVYKRWSIHPQSGLVWQPRDGEEIVVPGGAKLGLRVTTSTSQTADVGFDYEE